MKSCQPRSLIYYKMLNKLCDYHFVLKSKFPLFLQTLVGTSQYSICYMAKIGTTMVSLS